MKSFLFTLTVLAFLASCSSADKETERKIHEVENSLAPAVVFGDSITNSNLEVRMRQTGIRGLSIAVIKDYKIAWAKAYGWADSAAGRRVTTDTRFQAASISKSINSLGILRLIQEGKLEGEADINQYLKSWQFPYDSVAEGKKINTYNLLSHTGGLTVHGFPGYTPGDSLPTLVQILNGERPANTAAVRSQFAPGLRFQYSGGGTTISQLLLQDITGQDYASYMEANVLKPLGMNNSSYQQPPASGSDLATGYYMNGKPVKGNYHVYPEQAAAGLWTTPTDLARYIIECQLALEGRSSKVLSQEMMKKRMTPYIDTAAALGVFIHNTGSEKYFNHNGGNEAFLCTSFGSLEGGNGVVIMVNGENFAVITELLNSVARVYGWKDFYKPEYRKLIKPDQSELDAYTGRFLLGTDTIRIFRRNNSLFAQQNGEPAMGFELMFSHTDSFSIREEPAARFSVQRNQQGGVAGLRLHQGQMNLEMKRMEDQ